MKTATAALLLTLLLNALAEVFPVAYGAAYVSAAGLLYHAALAAGLAARTATYVASTGALIVLFVLAYLACLAFMLHVRGKGETHA